MQNVLSIGGTYFLGRVTSFLAMDNEEIEYAVLNRGSLRFGSPLVREFVADRRDPASLQAVDPFINKNGSYDAVIDFCAYEPGDIKNVLNNLPVEIDHYIFISTANVYEPSNSVKDEKSPLLSRIPPGPAGRYCFNKLLLEQELVRECDKKQIPWTILRPAFIFGPYNYAPRENWFFESAHKGPVPFPTDATGRFSMVYVKDVAEAIFKCINNRRAYGKCYNLACPEVLTYEKLREELNYAIPVFETEDVTVRQVYEQNIPLPFPLEGSEEYSGHLITEDLGHDYSSFRETFTRTYNNWRRANIK